MKRTFEDYWVNPLPLQIYSAGTFKYCFGEDNFSTLLAAYHSLETLEPQLQVRPKAPYDEAFVHLLCDSFPGVHRGISEFVIERQMKWPATEEEKEVLRLYRENRSKLLVRLKVIDFLMRRDFTNAKEYPLILSAWAGSYKPSQMAAQLLRGAQDIPDHKERAYFAWAIKFSFHNTKSFLPDNDSLKDWCRKNRHKPMDADYDAYFEGADAMFDFLEFFRAERFAIACHTQRETFARRDLGRLWLDWCQEQNKYPIFRQRIHSGEHKWETRKSFLFHFIWQNFVEDDGRPKRIRLFKLENDTIQAEKHLVPSW